MQIQNLTIKNISNNKVLVDNISLALQSGEITALIGESGSGKSLTTKFILGIIPDNLSHTGKFIFSNSSKSKKHCIIGKDICYIPQEPLTSLNPVLSIRDQMEEVLQVHTSLNKKQRYTTLIHILNEVNLKPASEILRTYPHQLSGGMRQRVLIATAFMMKPQIVIADEPTTALDVLTQKSIITTFKKMQSEYRATALWVTHDLALASQIASYFYIMQSGQIVEQGTAKQVFTHPKTSYTQKLINACQI